MTFASEAFADAGAALCFGAVCWLLGVFYAAYKAIGWEDGIRRWAAELRLEETETPAPGLAGKQIPSKGEN